MRGGKENLRDCAPPGGGSKTLLVATSAGCPLLLERGTGWGLKKKGGYLRAGVPQGPEKL